MITEATVIISEWLKSSDHGVNTMLKTVPINKPGGGTYPKPSPVTVYDDCSDDCVSMELEPDAVPAVVVFADSDIRFEMDMHDPTEQKKGQKADGLIVAVAYIVRDADPLTARRDGGFVLRAVKMSLNRFNTPRIRGAKTANNRGLLNDVHLVKISDIRMQRVAGSVGLSTLAGFVLATCWLYDKRPG